MIAYAALDVASGRLVERDADRVLPAASTIKLLVSVALWRAVGERRVDPRRRIRVAATPAPGGGGLLESLDRQTELALADLDLLMLAVSDNAATNVLVDLLGFEAVNEEASRLGLRATALRRRMGDVAAAAAGRDNTTCARDLVTVLAALARPGAIPRPAARRVLAALAQSHHTDILARALPALPGERLVYPKQGELESVRHDAALVDARDGRIAVAVLSSPPAAPEGLAAVGRAAVGALAAAGR